MVCRVLVAGCRWLVVSGLKRNQWPGLFALTHVTFAALVRLEHDAVGLIVEENLDLAVIFGA